MWKSNKLNGVLIHASNDVAKPLSMVCVVYIRHHGLLSFRIDYKFCEIIQSSLKIHIQ